MAVNQACAAAPPWPRAPCGAQIQLESELVRVWAQGGLSPLGLSQPHSPWNSHGSGAFSQGLRIFLIPKQPPATALLPENKSSSGLVTDPSESLPFLKAESRFGERAWFLERDERKAGPRACVCVCVRAVQCNSQPPSCLPPPPHLPRTYRNLGVPLGCATCPTFLSMLQFAAFTFCHNVDFST